MGTSQPERKWQEGQDDSRYLRELGNVHPDVRHLAGRIAVPPYAFAPDAWSVHLLGALRGIDLEGLRVLEVGVGSGFLAICLLSDSPGIAQLYGADLEPRLAELSARNADRVLPPALRARYQHCPGANNLLSWHSASDLPRPDVVYGCVPQVPLPQGTQLDSRDNSANYYPAEEFPSPYNSLGLGLNDHLLRQARAVLAPGGRIVLNLAGRVRLHTLTDLFLRRGFSPRVLAAGEVRQHADTSLEPYVQVEEESADSADPVLFNFFIRGRDGERRTVDARAAEALRQAGEPCYHRIYAIEGRAYWTPKPAVP